MKKDIENMTVGELEALLKERVYGPIRIWSSSGVWCAETWGESRNSQGLPQLCTQTFRASSLVSLLSEVLS